MRVQLSQSRASQQLQKGRLSSRTRDKGVFDQAGMPLTLLSVEAIQRAKKPVVDTGITNWVTTDLMTQIVPRDSTFCRMRQLLEVQGY